MKNRILALLLVLSFAILSLPLTLVATAAGNDGEPDGPAEDTVLFSNASNNTSATSGKTDNRWNRNQPGGYVSMQVTADPENPDINVTKVLGRKAGCDLLRKWIPTDTASVFEAALYIAPPTSGSWMTKLTLKMQQNVILTLTRNETTGRYDIVCGGFTGSVAGESWFRTAMDILPDDSGKATFRFFLLGDILDADGNAQKGFSEVFENMNFTGGEWHLYYDVPEDSEAGFLIRSARNYIPGDLVVSEPVLPTDEDGNTVLHGQAALPLSHVPDPSTLSVGAVHLTTATGDAVVISDVRYREADNALLLDFSRHPLIENTRYLLNVSGIRDAAGKAPYAADFTLCPTLAGMGGEGDLPPASDTPVYETPMALPEYGYVMPDRYNTGYRCAEEDLVPAAEKYPDCFGGTSTVMTINDTTAAKYGYDFSGFSLTGSIKIRCSRPVSLHDFYLNSDAHYGIENVGEVCPMVTVSWMEGEGSQSAFFNLGNVTIRHAYVHDVKADHMKGFKNQLVESCYFRDGGTRNPGAHADAIQYSGSSSQIVNRSRVMGTRMDLPHLLYEHVANCCFFFKPEASFGGGPVLGFSNVQASGNWFNGGGFTTYLTPACPLDRIHYVTYTNNKIGYGHNFGAINFGAYGDADGFRSYEGNAYDGNGYVEMLEAGSVVYYAVSGDTKTRVYDMADMTTGEMEVLVNFANYMTVARSYRIEVTVTAADGTVIASGSGADTIRRYIPVRGADGYLENNTHTITVTAADGTTSEVTALIEMPDLPSDVEATVRLSGLPADLAGCRTEVKIYDTTGDLAAGTMIRSSALTDAVTENEALYDFTPTHTVTFLGMNDAVIGTATVRHNRAVTLPDAPEVAGYVFTGWSDNGISILRDTTIRASYTEGYVVTFYGMNDTVLSRQAIVAGQAALAPDAPAVAGYRFMGWDNSFDNVTRTLDVRAVYKRICTVTFRAADGTILKAERVLAGDDATPPEAPALDGYTFTGWVGSYTDVYTDCMVTAGYDGLFTVTFLGWKGAVLKTEIVLPGASATPPVVADTEAHPFTGWDTDAYLSVNAHLVVRACFDVYYTVTFLGRTGEVLSTETVLSGGSVTPPAAPVLPGYTFIGWSLSTASVTDDMTVQALYEELPAVTAFRAAVAAAEQKEKADAPLSERYDAFCDALVACRALSDAELSALPELTVKLLRMLDNYNAAVRAANAAMSDAESMRVG